jgi:6-phosphogluconolactonase (cycloisomerase 2 family)
VTVIGNDRGAAGSADSRHRSPSTSPKASGNSIDVFRVGYFGELSPFPVVNAQPPGTVPFAVSFDAAGHLVIANAGSASESGFQENPATGQLTLPTPATSTSGGTVDASASAGGQFLYIQTGASGIVDGYQVNANGSLTPVGSPVTVPLRRCAEKGGHSHSSTGLSRAWADRV